MSKYTRAKITIVLETGEKLEADGVARIIPRDPADHQSLRCYSDEARRDAEYCRLPERWFDFEGSTFPAGMQITMRL
jgi:hypothetical protein